MEEIEIEVLSKNVDIVVDKTKIEPNLQSKTVTPTEQEQTIVCDEGYDALDSVTVNAIPLQSKSQTITTNNTTTTIVPDSEYSGLSSVEITTNISNNFKIPNEVKLGFSSYIPNNIDTSEVTDMVSMFEYSTVTSLPQIDTSNVVNMKNMFNNCINLTSLPQIDTSNVTDMQNFCNFCIKLVNVPVLDCSNIKATIATNTANKNMFNNCPLLSNESLNNILAMCKDMQSYYSSHKTLKRIGLSSEQATICTGLSNWSALQSAGWTTGY